MCGRLHLHWVDSLHCTVTRSVPAPGSLPETQEESTEHGSGSLPEWQTSNAS